MRETSKGLILKTVNVGESDRLLTVLTADRGKITVSAKVTTSTRISLLGAVLQILTKPLHSHMLYATMKRIAAMVGMGISAA